MRKWLKNLLLSIPVGLLITFPLVNLSKFTTESTQYKHPISSPKFAQGEVLVAHPVIPPILLKIAYCESGNRQFNPDGSVIRGKSNYLDVGRFQINLFYHASTSKALGFDLFTEKGNTDYALWLYGQQGTKPWKWSEFCWNPT